MELQSLSQKSEIEKNRTPTLISELRKEMQTSLQGKTITPKVWHIFTIFSDINLAKKTKKTINSGEKVEVLKVHSLSDGTIKLELKDGGFIYSQMKSGKAIFDIVDSISISSRPVTIVETRETWEALTRIRKELKLRDTDTIEDIIGAIQKLSTSIVSTPTWDIPTLRAQIERLRQDLSQLSLSSTTLEQTIGGLKKVNAQLTVRWDVVLELLKGSIKDIAAARKILTDATYEKWKLFTIVEIDAILQWITPAAQPVDTEGRERITILELDSKLTDYIVIEKGKWTKREVLIGKLNDDKNDPNWTSLADGNTLKIKIQALLDALFSAPQRIEVARWIDLLNGISIQFIKTPDNKFQIIDVKKGELIQVWGNSTFDTTPIISKEAKLITLVISWVKKIVTFEFKDVEETGKEFWDKLEGLSRIRILKIDWKLVILRIWTKNTESIASFENNAEIADLNGIELIEGSDWVKIKMKDGTFGFINQKNGKTQDAWKTLSATFDEITSVEWKTWSFLKIIWSDAFYFSPLGSDSIIKLTIIATEQFFEPDTFTVLKEGDDGQYSIYNKKEKKFISVTWADWVSHTDFDEIEKNGDIITVKIDEEEFKFKADGTQIVETVQAPELKIGDTIMFEGNSFKVLSVFNGAVIAILWEKIIFSDDGSEGSFIEWKLEKKIWNYSIIKFTDDTKNEFYLVIQFWEGNKIVTSEEENIFTDYETAWDIVTLESNKGRINLNTLTWVIEKEVEGNISLEAGKEIPDHDGFTSIFAEVNGMIIGKNRTGEVRIFKRSGATFTEESTPKVEINVGKINYYDIGNNKFIINEKWEVTIWVTDVRELWEDFLQYSKDQKSYIIDSKDGMVYENIGTKETKDKSKTYFCLRDNGGNYKIWSLKGWKFILETEITDVTKRYWIELELKWKRFIFTTESNITWIMVIKDGKLLDIINWQESQVAIGKDLRILASVDWITRKIGSSTEFESIEEANSIKFFTLEWVVWKTLTVEQIPNTNYYKIITEWGKCWIFDATKREMVNFGSVLLVNSEIKDRIITIWEKKYNLDGTEINEIKPTEQIIWKLKIVTNWKDFKFFDTSTEAATEVVPRKFWSNYFTFTLWNENILLELKDGKLSKMDKMYKIEWNDLYIEKWMVWDFTIFRIHDAYNLEAWEIVVYNWEAKVSLEEIEKVPKMFIVDGKFVILWGSLKKASFDKPQIKELQGKKLVILKTWDVFESIRTWKDGDFAIIQMWSKYILIYNSIEIELSNSTDAIAWLSLTNLATTSFLRAMKSELYFLIQDWKIIRDDIKSITPTQPSWTFVFETEVLKFKGVLTNGRFELTKLSSTITIENETGFHLELIWNILSWTIDWGGTMKTKLLWTKWDNLYFLVSIEDLNYVVNIDTKTSKGLWLPKESEKGRSVFTDEAEAQGLVTKLIK